MPKKGTTSAIVLGVLIGLLIYSKASAQTVQATLAGVVNDADGRGIPGAAITVKQEETGFSQRTESSSAGAYRISGLPIGNYFISVIKPGFGAAHVDSIRLYVGQARHLDVTLHIAGTAARVDVSVSGSEIDPVSASVGARLERRQISDLPVNGRNWASLLPLIPGATDPGTSDQRSVRFAGHGRDDNNITLDGVDATGISNQPQKTGIRLAVPTSTIAEFRVDSSLYAVDSADGTGGQVTLASSGGTNTLHGNVFEYLRNDVFDARNPFATGTQPFRLNQFGANLGGPLVHDKTFFFVAFEAYRQRLDQAVVGFTPSASYRAQVLAQSPALAPLINAYPVGNVHQANNAAIDRFVGLSPQRTDETSGMIRLDHRFTSRISSFVRVNVDEEVSDVPLNNLRDRTVVDNRPINGVISVNQVISPAILNETKVGFNQVFSRTNNQTPLPYTLSVTGFTNINSAQQKQEDDTSASLIDNLSLTHGRHTIKIGVEGRRVFTNVGNSASGTLSYTSNALFLRNQMDSASITSALPLKRLRKTQAFGYIQDEYRVMPTLTLNLGLRYQFFNVFGETQGRAIPFDFASCGGFCAPGAQFSNPRTDDLDPRVAIAWSPAVLRGKTVVRAGFGIYHGDGQLEDQNLPASNDVARYSLTSSQISGLAYPLSPYLAVTPGTLAPRAQNRNRKDEYSSQWSFSVQQELPLHVTGTVSYMGNKGTDLQTITYANVINPVTGTRPYPEFGQVEYRTNDSNSTFHALVLSGQRALRSGWVLGANYMWSHAINDGSLGGGEADIISPENPFCRACDRADSAQDFRHSFSANSVYELPVGAGKRFVSQPGVARMILGGWSLSGIATARSGFPVNVTLSRSSTTVPYGYNVNQRPDLVAGVSLTPPGGSTPGLWINPAAFAVPAPFTFGDAGRSIARGPSLYQLDMGLAKSFSVTERARIQFRWEVFNVANRAQYGQPSGTLVAGQFGLITSTINTTPVGTGTPREMQFMLQATF
jgi:hypothetical protein